MNRPAVFEAEIAAAVSPGGAHSGPATAGTSVPAPRSGVSAAQVRRATLRDAEALRVLHRASLRAMGADYYSALQIEGFLRDVTTVDPLDLADGTFLVTEIEGRIAASAAWTLRRPTYAPEQLAGGPGPIRATIRAVFTHPVFTRRGLAATLVRHCEDEAILHGRANVLELWATLSGMPLYRRLGYHAGETIQIPLPNGAQFPAVFMNKPAASSAGATA